MPAAYGQRQQVMRPREGVAYAGPVPQAAGNFQPPNAYGMPPPGGAYGPMTFADALIDKRRGGGAGPNPVARTGSKRNQNSAAPNAPNMPANGKTEARDAPEGPNAPQAQAMRRGAPNMRPMGGMAPMGGMGGGMGQPMGGMGSVPMGGGMGGGEPPSLQRSTVWSLPSTSLEPLP